MPGTGVPGPGREAAGSAGRVVNLSDLEKRYLFTPGPTPVPPQVLAAGAEPIVHHRGVDFREIYASTLDRLKGVYRTESDVLLFTASGSGAMESAVANLCEPGDRVAVVSHGSFGERWVAICEQHGVEVQAIRYEWGEVPDPDEIGRGAVSRSPGLPRRTSSCSALLLIVPTKGIRHQCRRRM